jgi:myosin V
MEKLLSTKFADLPPLKNPPMLEGIDDLSNLSYLHELRIWALMVGRINIIF